MTCARAMALVGSLCLHGVLLAFALRHPGRGMAGPDAGGDESGIFSAEVVAESPGEPEPSIPPPAAVSMPDVTKTLQPPREPVWEEEMVLTLDTGAAAVSAVQGKHRIPASSGGRMGKPVRIGAGKGGGGGTYVAPSYLKNPPPAYPLEARLSRHEGIVLLAVVVNEAGCAMEVKVLRSSGDAELDRAAVVTVTRWTFQPATAGGRTVTARVEVPVSFRLK